MAYKTLVASSATQQRWTIDSNAHTLQELKEEFRSNNIPFDGLAITEGLCTKAELTRDDAEIPVSNRTINYNGQTYSRVFLITNTRKQIASGAYNRKELYAKIKSYGLEETVKTKYGKNFTMVSSEKLALLIDSIVTGEKNASKKSSAVQKKVLKETREEIAKVGKKKEEENAPKSQVPDVKTAPHAQTVEWLYSGIKSMVKENTLFVEDVIVLADLITDLYKRLNEEQPKLSESDINNLINSFM